LLYTIFNGGAQKAQMRSAEDQEKQALYGYLSTVHQSFAEVTAALTGYQYLETQTAQLHKLVNTYHRTVELSTLRYYEGEGSFSDVLDQQSRYLATNIQYVESELDERLALVHLYEALGGGWQR
jgi:multidrug efflux system outer membrane protein